MRARPPCSPSRRWRFRAAACGRFMRGGEAGPVVQTLRGVQVAPIPGQNGWLVRTALQDRLGKRGGAVRYRLEVELSDDITGFGIRSDNAVTRERRTPARPLPADRRRARHRGARRHRRLRRRHRRGLSANMRPSPPSRPRSSGSPPRSPTRSSRASPSTPSAAAAAPRPIERAREGEPGAGREGAEGAGRHPLLPAPRPRRFGQPRAGPAARRGDGRGGRADRPQRRRAQGRSRPARRRGGQHLHVRRRPLDPGRPRRRRDRAGGRGAARGAGGRQSGGAARRRA